MTESKDQGRMDDGNESRWQLLLLSVDLGLSVKQFFRFSLFLFDKLYIASSPLLPPPCRSG